MYNKVEKCEESEKLEELEIRSGTYLGGTMALEHLTVFLVGSDALGCPPDNGLLHTEMRMLCCGVVRVSRCRPER